MSSKRFPRWLGLTVLLALAGGGAARADEAPAVPPWLNAQLAAADWRQEAPGVEVLAVAEPVAGGFAAFRLAQDKIAARVLGALEPTGSSAEAVLAASKALLVVNGGFFWIKDDGSQHPTGLLVVDGAKLAALRKCQACTGVLYTDGKGLHIVRPAAFALKHGIESALQVGPMLVENGAVLTFRPDGPASPRTAICATEAAITVIVAIRSMTLYELAALLVAKRAEGGFECTLALNLDGGSSSQLAANLPTRKGSLGFAAPVQNLLAFFAR